MHFLYYNLLDAEILKWLRKITANGCGFVSVCDKSELSSLGKIKLFREEKLKAY